jgi:hypothetical protein
LGAPTKRTVRITRSRRPVEIGGAESAFPGVHDALALPADGSSAASGGLYKLGGTGRGVQDVGPATGARHRRLPPGERGRCRWRSGDGGAVPTPLVSRVGPQVPVCSPCESGDGDASGLGPRPLPKRKVLGDVCARAAASRLCSSVYTSRSRPSDGISDGRGRPDTLGPLSSRSVGVPTQVGAPPPTPRRRAERQDPSWLRTSPALEGLLRPGATEGSDAERARGPRAPVEPLRLGPSDGGAAPLTHAPSVRSGFHADQRRVRSRRCAVCSAVQKVSRPSRQPSTRPDRAR